MRDEQQAALVALVALEQAASRYLFYAAKCFDDAEARWAEKLRTQIKKRQLKGKGK